MRGPITVKLHYCNKFLTWWVSGKISCLITSDCGYDFRTLMRSFRN
jgi:hypothetical protein